MSARTLSRRPHLAASTIAVAVVAGVCGSMLVPAAAAYADAPAPAIKPLHIEIGAPSPSGPLTRGGATEAYTVTATNNNDKAVEFNGLVFGIPGGPSAISGSQVNFRIDALSAPPTAFSLGAEGPSMLASFYPQGKKVRTFSVPARSSFSWKITAGLKSGFPANDTSLTLTFDTGTYENDGTGAIPSVTFQAAPGTAPGTGTGPGAPNVTEKFGPVAKLSPGKPVETWLEIDNESKGAIGAGLDTELSVYPSSASETRWPVINLEVRENGHWVQVKRRGLRDNEWMLPAITSGIPAGQKHRYELRYSVASANGVTHAQALRQLAVTYVSGGSGRPLLQGEGKLSFLPAAPATTPTGSPVPSSSATTNAPAPSVSATTNAPTTTNVEGSLAHTGADDNTGTLATGAGVLIAFGAAMAFFGLRRRRSHQH
ncbi:hypothetical protein QMK19_31015 [Streptomyces sp. H10-C2]|uniref:hypothetical protein n=1 Tax=unclassified Streptomyces TaxID=2593676 RepID=UPI0024B9E456|nr:MULTISPECIES: hypothetical protein [unclassified Streptomyces]MDJ0344965.1 hypothetical protein [Streptomyces sp. PH10-H1]MDJ0373954.1 hypothetical protein [Streptomyces sp. H10-C2]